MTSLDADFVATASAKKAWLRATDVPPVALVFGLAALALIWNLKAGLIFAMPLGLIVAGPFVCFALSAFYTLKRPEPKIAQTALYAGLWLFYPAFGVELSYLLTRLDFPLRDAWLLHVDQALGFDWMGWARFVLAHPLVKFITDTAYSSSFIQPLAAIVILAFSGPRNRNGEFLTSVMIGLGLSMIFYGLMPNAGPAAQFHVPAEQSRIIGLLRSGFAGPYNYTGIISFPSFHTVMAILFTLGQRGNRFWFAGFGVLNLLMLGGVPFQGDHYLTDMIAGMGIATLSFFAARRIYRAA